MDFEIKKAEYGDLEEILLLQKVCYEENGKRYNDFNIQPLTQNLEEIRKEFESETFLKVLGGNNKIIGSLRAYQNDSTCHIGKVIVHPDYQNKGIGTRLLKEVEIIFNDAKIFELFTGFKDEKNIHLYKKNGYLIYEEKKISDNFSLLFMEKRII